MPLRMILDGGAVEPTNVALVGARDLDPPERDFIESSGLHADADAIDRALDGADAVYVAIDGDGLDEDDVAAWMPVPGGISVADAERSLARLAGSTTIAGVGFAGFLPDPVNLEPARRLCTAAGL
jgi:arginase